MPVNSNSNSTKPSVLSAVLDNLTSEQKLTEALKILSDLKAEDVVDIDLRGKSTVGDFMIVTCGKSSRQVNAIANRLADHFKQKLHCSVRIEGKNSDDWILVDAGDLVVHIFRPEVREFYQLEKLWQTNPKSAKQA